MGEVMKALQGPGQPAGPQPAPRREARRGITVTPRRFHCGMAVAERNPGRNESAAHQLAAEQFGVISRVQAFAAGLSSAAISPPDQARDLGAGPAGRVRRRRRTRSRSGARSRRQCCGPAKVRSISHGTAGVLWGIDGTRAPKVELWVPSPRDPRHQRVVVHRGTRVDRADRTTFEQIPITTPIRYAHRPVGPHGGRPARRQRWRASSVGSSVRPERLAARLEALGGSGRPGAARLAALLERTR